MPQWGYPLPSAWMEATLFLHARLLSRCGMCQGKQCPHCCGLLAITMVVQGHRWDMGAAGEHMDAPPLLRHSSYSVLATLSMPLTSWSLLLTTHFLSTVRTEVRWRQKIMPRYPLYWKKIFNELLKFHCSFPFSLGDPAATETLELSVLPSEMSQRRGLAASQYSCRYHCVFCHPWKYFCALEAAWDPSALHTHQCLLASYLTGWLQENDKEHIIPVMRWWNKSLRLPKWLVILVVSIFGCCILFFRKCQAWRSVPLPAFAPFCLFAVDCSCWDKKWTNQS